MHQFSDILSKKTTLLFLIGSSNSAALTLLGDIGMARPILSKQLDVETVAISSATWEQMNDFREVNKSVLTNIQVFQDASGSFFENMACKKNKFDLRKKESLSSSWLGGLWVINEKCITFEHLEKTKGDYPSITRLLSACGASAEIINNCVFSNPAAGPPRGSSIYNLSKSSAALVSSPRNQNRKSWIKTPKTKKDDLTFAMDEDERKNTPERRARTSSRAAENRPDEIPQEDFAWASEKMDLEGKESLELGLLRKPLKRAGSVPNSQLVSPVIITKK
eukprot:TRINITY_DN3878_c1_g1_i3.p2 TRINITY_DN3878_c1_g1~~TRINITY_DN3878_c1_g1_i3.p2  ORF type:complete len:278 (-),score=42.12 TRINITY_DN3878_c1_g1_i3:54-887(-)